MHRATFFISLVLILSASVSKPQSTISPDKIYHDGTNEITTYEQYGMTIVSVSSGFDFLFFPDNADALKDVARTHGYRFMINGSYFDGSAEHAQHSGWLRIYGMKYAHVRIDSQLTHIVRRDSTSGRVELSPCTAFDSTQNTRTIEFQTGPLIIENNEVATSYIRHSVNGPGRYTRTLLGVIDNSRLYFITVTDRVSLDTLAQHLISLSIFKSGRLDVVNLDGGSSVALFVKKYPELNYNESAHLPMLLGVR